VNNNEIIKWLLKGDVSTQYQVHLDLLDTERSDLQNRIEREGWAAVFLSKRHPDGHWGQAFYQPKWISSHYTLCDLRNLYIKPDHQLIQESINNIATLHKTKDGAINHSTIDGQGDVCVNGMFLNYASYFKTKEEQLRSVVDFILSQRMPDGGFNCRSNYSGAKHSSLHTTLSVLEGIAEYRLNGYAYRMEELNAAERSAQEFILLHQLFISDRTGEIINKGFLRFAYPRRWKYDILSALDYFQYTGKKWDDRMQAAIAVLFKKRNATGTWNVQAKHPGQIHFEMEKAGKPSRWNTLRVLRVLKHFKINKILYNELIRHHSTT
jgi:hypothetical protein